MDDQKIRLFFVWLMVINAKKDTTVGFETNQSAIFSLNAERW